MNYIIFDLEATCWEGRNHNKTNETIEIGAVKINEQKEIVDEFVQFIKPLKNPILSDFCKELTSIKQEEVNQAPYYNIAIENFKKWIGNDDYILCSWGFYDRKQFESDCNIWNLDTEWITKHISLKHQHGKICNLRRNIGMKNALIMDDFILDGTHHRGIDDARNIAKIFLKYYDKWVF